MRTSSYSIEAGARVEIAASGNYVRVRKSLVELIIESGESNERVEVSEGDDFEFSPFKNLYITNTGTIADTIKLTIANGKKAGSAKVGGSVSLAGSVTLANGAMAQNRASLTNVSQQILAAKANRGYLLIQNNDAAAVLRVTVNGTAATVGQGFRIPAGSTFELPVFAANGAINCIMETATAAVGNVEFVEG